MSIVQVAQRAGVSTSTVSRVINAHPSVAPATLRTVRKAIEDLGFSRAPRRNGQSDGAIAARRMGTIAFLVLGTDGSTPAPAFLRLLQGVAGAAEEHSLDLVFSFVSDLGQLPQKIASPRLDGVLLHGELPSAAVQQQLRTMPSVWLMANRQRPTWGDQVMPENTVIGELGASYLIRRGHRNLAYLGVENNRWFVGLRTLAFQHAAAETGGRAAILMVDGERVDRANGRAGEPANDSWPSRPLVQSPVQSLWQPPALPEAGEALVDRLMAIHPRVTGLFVAEDRLLPTVYTALARHGLSIGAGGDVEIISCNNEKPHLLDVRPRPASIDIRSDAIGRCGVERLMWRMQNPHCRERIRMMIDPVLVEPAAEKTSSHPSFLAEPSLLSQQEERT